MRLLAGHTADVAKFVADIIGADRGFGPCEAIGFLNVDGMLEAGVVYSQYSPENGTIEISCAAINRRWGSRERIRAIFSYPFDQLGCQMVVARTSEHNAVPLRIWRAFGADEYRIPRLYGRDEACILHTLTEEQWRSSPWA